MSTQPDPQRRKDTARLRSRILPHPVLSAMMFVVWSLLQNSVALGTLIAGAILSIAIPLLTKGFLEDSPHTIRLAPMPALLAVVFWDILSANIRVAILVLGPMSRIHPRFVQVPLELTSPLALTTLAGIITLTPGTVSANISGDRRTLLVHALSTTDPDAIVADIKRRYERPLMEIFGC